MFRGARIRYFKRRYLGFSYIVLVAFFLGLFASLTWQWSVKSFISVIHWNITGSLSVFLWFVVVSLIFGGTYVLWRFLFVELVGDVAHVGWFVSILRRIKFVALLSRYVISNNLVVRNRVVKRSSNQRGNIRQKSFDKIVYFPKIRLKIKRSVLIIDLPIDGNAFMREFNGDNIVTDLEEMYMVDLQSDERLAGIRRLSFSLSPVSDQLGLSDLQLDDHADFLKLTKTINWNFDKVPHLLLAGNTGSGKSYFLFSILYQLNQLTEYIFIADPKRDDLASLANSERYHGKVYTTKSTILAGFDRYVERMYDRSKSIEANKRKGQLGTYRDFNMQPNFFVLDEVSAFIASLSKEDRVRFMDNLKQVIMMGRSVGFFVILSMQRPSVDSVPVVVREQSGLRVGLGNLGETTQSMVFGDDLKRLLRPLVSSKSGWGYLRLSSHHIRPFFAPIIPKTFNLVEDIGGGLFSES